MGGIILTHPHFPKLPAAKFFHKLQRLPWDLPFILCPGSLGNQGYAGSCESLAQAIAFLCTKTKHRTLQWDGRANLLLHLHVSRKSQPRGNLHNHTNVSATGIKAPRMDLMKGKSSKGAIEEQILLPRKSKPCFPSISPVCPFSIHLFPFLMGDTPWL